MELFKKIAERVAKALGLEPKVEDTGRTSSREEKARTIAAMGALPTAAKRRALAALGYSLRKFGRNDVGAVARAVLGPAARYTEQRDPTTPNGAFPEMVLGVVEAPGYHRMINRFERYAPGEGRRRVVSNLLNPERVKEMQK